MKTPLRTHSDTAFVIGEHEGTSHCHFLSEPNEPSISLWLARLVRDCCKLSEGALLAGQRASRRAGEGALPPLTAKAEYR
jgi:hypothetical protein